MALGAVGAGLAVVPASAQPLKVMKVANSAGVNDAQQAFITAGRHPRLGYYAAEGVDVEYVNMSSITQAMQALMTGQVAFGPVSPGLYLPALAKDPALDLIAAYKWLPRNANVVIVRPDSPIRSVADLQGKRIGVRNQGDPGIVVARTMLLELGLDDGANQYIAVGDGGPAGQALTQGRVDAIVAYDTGAARIEMVGVPVRYLPLPPKFAEVGSGWICVQKKSLQQERKHLVGLFRGIAKSTLFAHHNLDEAINIHWALYPESKPKSKSEDEARKELQFILKDRRNNWMRRDGEADARIGASSLAEWQANIASAAETSKNPRLAAELGDPARVFTNELIDEVNAFDKAAVIRQAKGFRL
ncbi:ABC transporter substrate-binding protein [Variovorax sp. J31P207]|uniref:ABC transporter substrate-binding protein n=1 Tax=Variovorax sp. J31P207 TaxID=3053510 RepID=UPI00257894FA|nr:ABC transporter substrate-binding protein [Variovorax sp. J31P207]MDM0066871.1 ABC transporter substrate-binding protein [Variovorax sp. J31P207]